MGIAVATSSKTAIAIGSTQPQPQSPAEDYRESYLRQKDELLAELNQLLAKEASKRGSFDGVHAAQIETSGIPDEATTRLVLLAAQYPHKRNQDNSPAREWVSSCLQSKGNSPGSFRTRWCSSPLTNRISTTSFRH